VFISMRHIRARRSLGRLTMSSPGPLVSMTLATIMPSRVSRGMLALARRRSSRTRRSPMRIARLRVARRLGRLVLNSSGGVVARSMMLRSMICLMSTSLPTGMPTSSMIRVMLIRAVMLRPAFASPVRRLGLHRINIDLCRCLDRRRNTAPGREPLADRRFQPDRKRAHVIAHDRFGNPLSLTLLHDGFGVDPKFLRELEYPLGQ
jgi:hypothetical protein